MENIIEKFHQTNQTGGILRGTRPDLWHLHVSADVLHLMLYDLIDGLVALQLVQHLIVVLTQQRHSLVAHLQHSLASEGKKVSSWHNVTLTLKLRYRTIITTRNNRVVVQKHLHERRLKSDITIILSIGVSCRKYKDVSEYLIIKGRCTKYSKRIKTS